MEDLIASICLGIIEMALVLLAALVFGVLWCLWLLLVAGGRFCFAALRVIQGLSARRAARRELAYIALEYQAAMTDIHRISQATRRQIRAVAEGRR